MPACYPGLSWEHRFRDEGFPYVAGLDEAGRGAWAGPVVAGAVILPLERHDLESSLAGVRDSKLCTARQRARLEGTIRQVALAVGIGAASSHEVDRMGVVPATRLAMRRAVSYLLVAPLALLIDFLHLQQPSLPSRSFPKGEHISLSIAAASIIAKVSRDRMMDKWDSVYPGYGWARHKGYGTSAHRQAIHRLGPCQIHRFSFAPIRNYIVAHSPDANRTGS